MIETKQLSDLLYGCEAIAAHLGLGIEQVKHRVRKRDMPTFKIGRSVCARRSTLNDWLANREAEALPRLTGKSETSDSLS